MYLGQDLDMSMEDSGMLQTQDIRAYEDNVEFEETVTADEHEDR